MKLALALSMMRKYSLMAVLGLSLVLGCQRPDRGEPGPPEISVFVTSTRVEVIAQQRGSCRVVTDVHDPDACETVKLVYAGPLTHFEPDCLPDPTCVDEILLERAGTLIATEKGRQATFSTAISGDETLVILGCGPPLRIDVPPPLTGVDLEVKADSDGIHLAATPLDSAPLANGGDGVQSLMGRAFSLTFFDGFDSACRSSSGPVTLPISPDYDEYTVESFALGEPVVLEGGSVRVYPARRRKEVVSTVLPLGAIWQATVAATKLSPHFEACDGYCSAWQQACYPSANRDQCNVRCVAESTLLPSCADELESKLACDRDPVVCDEVAHRDAESATAPPPACEAENVAYAACIGRALPAPPAEAD